MGDDQTTSTPDAGTACSSDGCAKPWESKQLWTTLILLLAPAFPPVQLFIAANPWATSAAVGLIMGAFRLAAGRKLPLVGSSGKPIGLK